MQMNPLNPPYTENAQMLHLKKNVKTEIWTKKMKYRSICINLKELHKYVFGCEWNKFFFEQRAFEKFDPQCFN